MDYWVNWGNIFVWNQKSMKLFPDLQLITKIINNYCKYLQNKEGNETIKYIIICKYC